MPYNTEPDPPAKVFSENVDIDLGRVDDENDDQNHESQNGLVNSDPESQHGSVNSVPENESSEQLHEPTNDYLLARYISRKEIRPPARYSDADFVYYALCVAEELELTKPATYRDAIGSKDKKKWIRATNEEIESLQKNKTWFLVLRSQVQGVRNLTSSAKPLLHIER